MAYLLAPQLTPRDIAILRELFHCRVMTLAHVAGLWFDGSTKAAAKRIRALKIRGLVAERPRLPQQPSILNITKRGFDTLKQEGALPDYNDLGWGLLKKRIQVSPLTLQHELDVMTVRVALEGTIRQTPGSTCQDFHTWPRLFQFRSRSPQNGRMGWMRPDAFIRIHERQADGHLFEHLLYAEIDRSTEPLQKLQRKAQAYLEHYKLGGMAAKMNRPRDEFRQFPFRVLWIFRNEERRNNAAEAFLVTNPPVRTQAWMTTIGELLNNPTGAIWMTPADYCAALSGTPYDVASQIRDAGYSRNPMREETVKGRVSLRALLPKRTPDSQTAC